MSGIVMFIHGAWLTPRAWERFAQRFAACGYTCLAPSWPSLEDIPAQRLREAPPAALGNLGVGRILAHYQALIEALPHPPLLVGHCYGGLFVQVLQPTLHITCAAGKQLGHGGQHQHGQSPANLLQ